MTDHKEYAMTRISSIGGSRFSHLSSSLVLCKWKRRSRLLASAAAASVLALTARHADAQATATWNGGNGNWSSAVNWDSGVVPNLDTTNVFIDGGKVASSTVTLDLN